MTKHRHRTMILAILHDYAPDEAAQQVCTKIMQDMLDEGEPDEKITLTLASSLIDGLRHGNWPWEIPKMSMDGLRGLGKVIAQVTEDVDLNLLREQQDEGARRRRLAKPSEPEPDDWSEGREQ